MHHATEPMIKGATVLTGAAMASAPTSTLFGFTMTNNEWVDSLIGGIGAIGFIYFQYQAMKDRRESKDNGRE